MSNSTHFEVQRGALVSDCMENTYDFINENLRYLHEALTPVRDELFDSSNFMFVCYEQQWTFALNVKKVELGSVSSCSGVIQEGGKCSYDELIASIS